MNLDIITKQDLNDFKEDLIKEISSIVEDSTLLQHFLQICIPSKLPPYVVNYLD